MSYRQGYTELEGQYTTLVAATTSGNVASFGANEIGVAELGIGACSGAAIGSASVGLPHLANASVSGLHLVAQGVGADRILNNAITATQLAVGVASGLVIGSVSVALQHHANASVSGLHLVAQGIGADRILNAAITATQIANAAGSGLIVSPGFGVISAGSPAAVGCSAYAGTGATGGGSDAWILYPGVTFAAAPTAIVPANAQAAGVTFFIPNGSIAVGSFYIQSSAASASFTYLAIGSGRSP